MAKQRRVRKEKPVKLKVKGWGGAIARKKKQREGGNPKSQGLTEPDVELRAFLTPPEQCKPNEQRINQPSYHARKLRERYSADRLSVAINMSGLNPEWEIKFLMKLVERGSLTAYQELKRLRNVVLERENKGKGRPSIVMAVGEESNDGCDGSGETDGGLSGEAGSHAECSASASENGSAETRSKSHRTQWD